MLERGPGPESQHMLDLFQGCSVFADAEVALLEQENKPGGGDAQEIERLNDVMDQGLEAVKNVVLAQAKVRGHEALKDLDTLGEKNPDMKSAIATIKYELLCALLDNVKS